MNYIQEQIERANQIDLVQVLYSQGETVIKTEMNIAGNGLTA